MYREEDMEAIVGKKITAIYMDEDNLAFETDQGLVKYQVEGDCCSRSYFYDFYGVKNLLENGPVTAFEMVNLSPGDPEYRPETWQNGVGWSEGEYEDVKVYGYRFTTVHPQFGEVSSVVSFRNASNGYYGGDMQVLSNPTLSDGMKRIESDVVGG